MKIVAVVVLALLVSAPARAEETAFRTTLVAAVVAHAMDLAETEHCLGAGKCTEVNPWLARFESPSGFAAAKMTVACLSLWATAKLHENHPTLAMWTNLAVASGFSAIAMHNARQVR